MWSSKTNAIFSSLLEAKRTPLRKSKCFPPEFFSNLGSKLPLLFSSFQLPEYISRKLKIKKFVSSVLS